MPHARAGEERDAAAEDDRDDRDDQLVDEPLVEQAADERAAIDVDPAWADLRLNGLDEIGRRRTVHCPHGRGGRLERARRRHEHGRVAVRPVAVEARDDVVERRPMRIAAVSAMNAAYP